jgi:hypothetical protein
VEVRRIVFHSTSKKELTYKSFQVFMLFLSNYNSNKIPDEQIHLPVGMAFFSFVQTGDALSAGLLLLANGIQARFGRAESLIGM